MPLFDTDVLIDILRGKAGAKEAVLKYSGMENLISVITYSEILFGMREHEDEKTLMFLNAFKTVGVEKETAEIALDIKRRSKGHALELYDCLIAATAIKRNIPLITRNKKHYPDKRVRVITPEY